MGSVMHFPANISDPENDVCLLRQLHVFKCDPDQFYHVNKHYETL